MPHQLPRMASVQALIPVELNNRLQNICARSRLLFGDDYGTTFEQIIKHGIWTVEAKVARAEDKARA